MLEKTDIGKEHNHQCSPCVILSVCQYHTDKYKGHPGDGIGLTIMRGGDDDKEIA